MSIDWMEIAVWGLVASCAMALVEACGLWIGWTRLNTPIILGSVLYGDRDRAAFVGVLMHIGVGLVFAMVYAMIFHVAGVASWWLGLLLGIVHALFLLGVLLPVLPAVHPRMAGPRAGPLPSRALGSPGFLGLHYGRATLIVSVVAHAAFGVLLGALYHL